MAYKNIMDTINIQLIKQAIDKWEFIFVENGNPALRAQTTIAAYTSP